MSITWQHLACGIRIRIRNPLANNASEYAYAYAYACSQALFSSSAVKPSDSLIYNIRILAAICINFIAHMCALHMRGLKNIFLFVAHLGVCCHSFGPPYSFRGYCNFEAKRMEGTEYMLDFQASQLLFWHIFTFVAVKFIFFA